MVALDLHLESAASQHGQAKLNVEEYAKGSLLSGGNYKEEKIDGSDADDYEKYEKGIMQYGCPHYRRRCHIRAPCCNEIFDCRHCHNEVKNSINVDTMKRHELPKCSRLYAHYVTQNKRYGKYASIVVYAWGSTSVDCASSLTMMFLNSSITAMDVEYVELEGGRISSTAQNVDVVIQLC